MNFVKHSFVKSALVTNSFEYHSIDDFLVNMHGKCLLHKAQQKAKGYLCIYEKLVVDCHS